MTNSMNWMPTDDMMDDIVALLPMGSAGTPFRRVLMNTCLDYFAGPDGDPENGVTKAIRTYHIIAYRLNMPS